MSLLIIKIMKGTSIETNLRNACQNKSYYIYNTTNQNKNRYTEIYTGLKNTFSFLNTIFIIHENNEPQDAYICKSQKIESNSNILCKDLSLTCNHVAINKLIKDSHIDLKKDFESGIYIYSKSIPDSTYLEFINTIYPPYTPKGKSIQEQIKIHSHSNLEEPMDLHSLAQRNEYCIRPLCMQQIDTSRSEFQRDRERIIHTKAYRRLVDKAQIFTSNKGDHYRTRMTHTLEVSQIARGIALKLKLNLDLTESIALGHDIGHTPFGHQGERTIDDIIKGNIDIIPNAKELNIGGFKHNYQALRVLTYLEEKYIEHEGIDLSYQTLEGILKHTKCKKDYEIKNFLINGETEYLYLNDDSENFSVTLEGQIVEIADEIAQRGHDLDDAFAAGLLNLHTLKDACKINEMNSINKIINDVETNIKKYKDANRIIINETDMIRAMLVPKILGFLIKDVIDTSNENMDSYDHQFFTKHKRVDKKLIAFSHQGDFIIEYLDTLISRNVINSFEVSRFDEKAKFIISALFKAYYNNPRLLPDSILIRFRKELSKISVNPIDLRFENPQDISTEINEITQITDNQISCNEIAIEYENKRKILSICIADHISGMTDNYALNEYSKLYEGFPGNM